MGCQIISLKALAINIKHANAILSAILCKDSIKHPLHRILLWMVYSLDECKMQIIDMFVICCVVVTLIM